VKRLGWLWMVVPVLVAVAGVAPSRAGNVRRALRQAPSLVGLSGLAADGRYHNAADIILEQGIRNLPLHPAASPVFAWRRNPDTGAWERATDAVSPWYVERGPTLGRGVFTAGLTFGYFDVQCSSGCRIGTDPYPLSVSAAAIDYQAPTDLTYSITTVNLTYGVTDDLDVNVAIPVATLDADLQVTRRDNPTAPLIAAWENVGAANFADTLLRAKYRLFQSSGDVGTATGAAGVRVRLPTGRPSRGLGTGYGEIGPYSALTANLLEGWLDSSWAAGVDFTIGDFGRSSGHYAWALDVHTPRRDDWWSRVAFSWSVNGRSEFTSLRVPPSYSGPHVTPNGIVNSPYLCADGDRHDYVDTTLGLRTRLFETVVLSLGVFKPINSQGVRAGWSPLASVQGTF
jgi:hypothetical protein